jgi:hypothetical protein
MAILPIGPIATRGRYHSQRSSGRDQLAEIFKKQIKWNPQFNL